MQYVKHLKHAQCTRKLCSQTHFKALNALHSAIAICNTRNCSLLKCSQKGTTNSFWCPRKFFPRGILATADFAWLPQAACSRKFLAFLQVPAHGHLPCAKAFSAPPHHHRQNHFRPLTQAGWPCAFATRSACSFVFLRMPFSLSSLLGLGHTGRQKKKKWRSDKANYVLTVNDFKVRQATLCLPQLMSGHGWSCCHQKWNLGQACAPSSCVWWGQVCWLYKKRKKKRKFLKKFTRCEIS